MYPLFTPIFFVTLSKFKKARERFVPEAQALAAEFQVASRLRTQCAIVFWTGNRYYENKINIAFKQFFRKNRKKHIFYFFMLYIFVVLLLMYKNVYAPKNLRNCTINLQFIGFFCSKYNSTLPNLYEKRKRTFLINKR